MASILCCGRADGEGETRMFLGVARMVFPSLLLAVITTVRLADDGPGWSWRV